MSSSPPIRPTSPHASKSHPEPAPKPAAGGKAHRLKNHIAKLMPVSGDFKFKIWKNLSGKLPDFLMRRLSVILVKASLIPSIPKEKMTALSIDLLNKMTYSEIANLNLQQIQELAPRLKNLDTGTLGLLFSAHEGRDTFDVIEQSATDHLQENIKRIKDDQIKNFLDNDSELRSLYLFLNRVKISNFNQQIQDINSDLCRRFARSFKDRTYEADNALKNEIGDASQMRGTMPFTESKETFDYEGKEIPLIHDFEIDIHRTQEYVINGKVFGKPHEDISRRGIPDRKKVFESLYLAANKDLEVFKQLQQVLYQGSFQPFLQIASDKYVLDTLYKGPLMMMDVRQRKLEVNTLNENEWIFKYSMPDTRIKDINDIENPLIKLNITAEVRIHPEDFKKGDFSQAQVKVWETFS